MKQAIDELKAIPGVVGACLFGAKEGLVQSNLPGMFKPDKLSAVGKQLSKLLVAGRMSFEDLNDLTLHYDESVVIARELRKGLMIFAICDPSFNHNLLTMSLNLLQEEMREEAEAQGATPAAPVEAATPSVTVKAEAELGPLLKELRTLLAKILGPMAGIIFDELEQDWTQQGASVARLDDLLGLIHNEIDDPVKSATYDELVAPLLQG